MSRPLSNFQNYLPVAVLKNFCSEKFLQIVIKTFVVDFIFSKILCFQHIFLSSLRLMHLKYENYSLRRMLFQTSKQHSVDKSLITKAFDGSRAKMKAASPVQVIKNKKKCFQFCLDWTNTLVLTTHFLRARLKSRVPRKKFVYPCKSFFSRDAF